MVGRTSKYFVVSIISHLIILSILVYGFAFSHPLDVFENTNKHDVISAVVLGDNEKSKILTPKAIPIPVPPKPVEPPKPIVVAKPKIPEVKKEVISLKAPPAKPKPLPKPKFVATDLLEDLKKLHQQKVIKQKELNSQFQKTLRLQAEESLRQQMIKEDLKLQEDKRREAQGRVNKFVALIIQSMAKNWVIPQQSKKNLNGELMIRLKPGGEVIDVQITRSSGDPALDGSARAAVFKASPLPVPSDPEEFANFKQFNLKFSPKDVLDNAV